MRVLINRKYYVALPKCSQAARTLIVYLLKSLYKKELKNAKMITVKEKLETGILTKRTI